jgi:hypothetical protein
MKTFSYFPDEGFFMSRDKEGALKLIMYCVIIIVVCNPPPTSSRSLRFQDNAKEDNFT